MKISQKGFIAPLLLALIALLILGGGAYMYMQKQPATVTQTTATSTTQIVGWETYTNTKYGYTLSYPKDAMLQPRAEEERLPSAESMAIQIERGGTSDIGIEITTWVTVPVYGDANDVNNPNYQIDKGIIEDNRIIKLDLKSFSEELRKRFVADKNHNFPDKSIGPLEEIRFAGHQAYAATVTGYMDGYGSDTFRYIYLDDGKDKFVLQYSLKGNLSEQIITTFKFNP